ncbi:MAG: UDP-N-acetylmuramate dehydrogenase [Chitinophagales bacterium]
MLENISLKPYNSFGIDVLARKFAVFSDEEQLKELLAGPGNEAPFILGGGSNVLFTKNIDGLVLKNDIRGIDLIKEDERHIYVHVGGGESWHPFVMYCIQRHWAGIENLSLIPGNVGAAPMQNIGAYGVELKEVFDELEAYDLKEKKIRVFTVNDCQFGYRDSVFKKQFKDRFVILRVTFRLNKVPHFNTRYGVIEEELGKMGVKELSIEAISQAVIRIRTSKLPDPMQIGNAGSFFKNPGIPKNLFINLRNEFPGIVGYENSDGTIKLAAAWLIESCGWKGFRRGDAGCHAKQALVLVNYGHATGKEIYNLSTEIQQSVFRKFGVKLEREVNII